jgi:hypothetical protein
VNRQFSSVKGAFVVILSRAKDLIHSKNQSPFSA